MFETITGGIIVSFIGILAFIAYNHPNYFSKKMFKVIYIIFFILLIAIATWCIGVNIVFNELKDKIKPDEINNAMQFVNNVTLSPIWNIYFILFFIYLWVLDFFVTKIKNKD